MAKNTKRRSGLADPTQLPPLDAESKQTIQVIIETPKGSRNKYASTLNREFFSS